MYISIVPAAELKAKGNEMRTKEGKTLSILHPITSLRPKIYKETKAFFTHICAVCAGANFLYYMQVVCASIYLVLCGIIACCEKLPRSSLQSRLHAINLAAPQPSNWIILIGGRGCMMRLGKKQMTASHHCVSTRWEKARDARFPSNKNFNIIQTTAGFFHFIICFFPHNYITCAVGFSANPDTDCPVNWTLLVLIKKIIEKGSARGSRMICKLVPLRARWTLNLCFFISAL